MKIIILSSFLLASFLSSVAVEAGDKETKDKIIPVVTIQQEKVRSSYPFPDFLSTAPYVWYENTEKTPLKGHTYRIATFSNDQAYRVYIEKVEFGDGGCCLEIVEYRELVINEEFLKKNFPKNKGRHGFKLLRWLKSEIFEFEAYGGKYKLSHVGNKEPFIKELKN